MSFILDEFQHEFHLDVFREWGQILGDLCQMSHGKLYTNLVLKNFSLLLFHYE